MMRPLPRGGSVRDLARDEGLTPGTGDGDEEAGVGGNGERFRFGGAARRAMRRRNLALCRWLICGLINCDLGMGCCACGCSDGSVTAAELGALGKSSSSSSKGSGGLGRFCVENFGGGGGSARWAAGRLAVASIPRRRGVCRSSGGGGPWHHARRGARCCMRRSRRLRVA